MVDVSTIKNRLRINHSKLDDQLAQDIETAKAELVRVGISETAVNNENDPLIDYAIISYCMWAESSDDRADSYKIQWFQRKDELRKTPKYQVESE